MKDQQRTRLAQRYAEIYVRCQDDYSALLLALDDDAVGHERFDAMAHELAGQVSELKALRLRLNGQKAEAKQAAESMSRQVAFQQRAENQNSVDRHLL
jgi:hypothetical protein